MPNIKSAVKRVKTSLKKAKTNTLVTSEMKNSIKKFDKEVKSGNKENLDSKLKIATKAIDKAASSGTIKKNKAARDKSRIAKAKNKASN
ncbi:MAG: 30S ribosomal protein S20 [Bacilli bacterium]